MDSQTPAQPVSEVPNPTPLPAEALAKEGPVSETPPVIPDLIRDPSPIDPKPTKKLPLKLAIGIILFLLLAGGAAAGYVYKDKIVSMVAKPTPSPTVIPDLIRDPSPTPNPTADWQTYEGDGFSIKIPPTWYSSSDKKRWYDPCYIYNQNKDESKCPKTIDTFLEMSLIPNPSNVSLSEYIGNVKKKWGKPLPGWSGDEYDVKITTSIYGRETATGNVLSVQGGSFVETLINTGDNIISIICFSCNVDFNNQILSTFKFTDTQTVDTSNWKTYTSKNGFELKHPTDWKVIDNSYSSGGGLPNRKVGVLSPVKYDLKGFESIGYSYHLLIDLNGDNPLVQFQNFIKGHPDADQTIEGIDVSDEYLKNSIEYKMSKEIVKSEKIN